MKKQRRITLILLIVFFVGLSVLLYPSFANYWNSKTQTRLITNYDKKVDEMSYTDYTAQIEKARAYNSNLAALNFPLSDFENISGYTDSLNVNGDGMIGHLSIDKLQILLPIYHGADDSVLNFACGHIEGTSLPIGGLGTHAVLSAHRGLPNSKLFTNLDRMEEGDLFKISVLGEEYIYEVDQIKTVTPSDTNDIQIVNGMDYCTLLTCTPYGINTHRLLVRGVRVESALHRTLHVTSEAFRINTFLVTISVALPIVLIFILVVIFKPAKKKVTLEDLESDNL